MVSVSTVAATTPGVTLTAREQIQESVYTLLDSENCKNILRTPLPPLLWAGEAFEYLHALDDFDKDIQEVWTIEHTGIAHDPLTFGTHSQYDQHQQVEVEGYSWQGDTYRTTHDYIHDQAEKVLFSLEKNKNLLSGNFLEVSAVQARFEGLSEIGGQHLYKCVIGFVILMRRIETNGRVTAS
tara:strand:+ start:2220 stop:2765 length:546 start_codon:yes stop_codon:yes gene_type:complete